MIGVLRWRGCTEHPREATMCERRCRCPWWMAAMRRTASHPDTTGKPSKCSATSVPHASNRLMRCGIRMPRALPASGLRTGITLSPPWAPSGVSNVALRMALCMPTAAEHRRPYCRSKVMTSSVRDRRSTSRSPTPSLEKISEFTRVSVRTPRQGSPQLPVAIAGCGRCAWRDPGFFRLEVPS